MYVYIYIYIYIHTYIHMYIHTYIRTCMHAYIYHTNIRMYVHSCTLACMHSYIQTDEHIHNTHTYSHFGMLWGSTTRGATGSGLAQGLRALGIPVSVTYKENYSRDRGWDSLDMTMPRLQAHGNPCCAPGCRHTEIPIVRIHVPVCLDPCARLLGSVCPVARIRVPYSTVRSWLFRHADDSTALCRETCRYRATSLYGNGTGWTTVAR